MPVASGGVVLAASADGDLGVKTRFFVVLAEAYEETVVELVKVDSHGIGRVRPLDEFVVGEQGKRAQQKAQRNIGKPIVSHGYQNVLGSGLRV